MFVFGWMELSEGESLEGRGNPGEFRFIAERGEAAWVFGYFDQRDGVTYFFFFWLGGRHCWGWGWDGTRRAERWVDFSCCTRPVGGAS